MFPTFPCDVPARQRGETVLFAVRSTFRTQVNLVDPRVSLGWIRPIVLHLRHTGRASVRLCSPVVRFSALVRSLSSVSRLARVELGLPVLFHAHH